MGIIPIETTTDQNKRDPKAENRITQLNNVPTGAWTWKTWEEVGVIGSYKDLDHFHREARCRIKYYKLSQKAFK